ncbi:hypothetical protein [Acinetobacter baumannii]|uniref:hypothetical protein n=1 Tax=Acinetobacter baumannii TaxID=470 RepID=UPI0019D20B6D|nr:hypothetical protein [Acinetobacter baumannii]HBY7915527.1 hypothetical protein [Acinetobacter baumannii]HBY9044680.1 hypothetical protein [Acinetobacter baumannii]HDZ1844683.1 hypothetical protein [Acinetobacter baumannii]
MDNCKIKSGRHGLVAGVGVNDFNGPIRINGKKIWEYNLWRNVLSRCYNQKFLDKCPSYIGVNCSEEWFVLSKFVEDIHEVPNHHRYELEGWNLDKDILIKGNRTYSKDAVCFVPKEINSLFTKSDATRGSLPIGVHLVREGVYTSSIRLAGKKTNLGCFRNSLEAFETYKQAKHQEIKRLANKWKDQIHDSVYEALLRYEVSIND